ncbi:RQT complex subunit Rqt4 [Schizosaccharomyces pombe]|uniref:RQC trigger complex subunit RQT4 homolog n=1 Tax=Schizosaccharomyces pombe (strain 972 / ATCC 24843) TaxID=284812 RepID=RQT4_SCHPO|nr:uncharacterized protein SPAC1A6.01c [Schizosaccharomyces pombe]O13855.3 RecName: Full=RQC trigger complex subunit RQT4 homolog [Schizosaccharomyces pombe 972h-]CAB16891.1 human thyroid receptor interacting protein homolog, transcription coactivator (predicted) [Schizosaccharomyces pombe]|eukprot:NP_593192.1 uncharacterized protein SPAC1A6.01c [Schizosaccharomyces pombe]
MEKWTKENVLKILPVDDESAAMITSTALAVDSSEAAKDYWISLLGDSAETIEFISDFNQKRFHSTHSGNSPSIMKNKKNVTPNNNIRQKNTATSSHPSFYIANNKQKGYDEEMYKVNPASRNKSQSNNISSHEKSSKTTKNVSPGVMTSDLIPEKKSVKHNNSSSNRIEGLADIEKAIRQIEISQNINKAERRVCNCQGRKHPLNEAAPNCLNCGKIICIVEGIGPCTFCDNPVISKAQQLELIQELKHEGSRLKQAANQKRKSKTVSSKNNFQRLQNSSLHSIFLDPKQLEQKAQEAEERKNVLLNFDRTSAQRTRIIDEAADFDPTSLASDTWASPAEKALNLVRMQKAMAKKEKKKKKVLSISLSGKKVVVDQKEASSESSDEDQDELDNLTKVEGQSHSHNPKAPVIRNLPRPIYHQDLHSSHVAVPESILNKINQKWSKVQDDDGMPSML